MFDASGKEIARSTDWFEKRVYDWLANPVGVGEKVPAPFTDLRARGRQIECWGRTYTFDDRGLLVGVRSQGKELLAGPVLLRAQTGGRELQWEVAEPFRFTREAGNLVEFQAALGKRGLHVSLRGEVDLARPTPEFRLGVEERDLRVIIAVVRR